MQYAPIALFAYNRPEHIRQTLDSLRRNPGAERSRVYAFSDGAKQPSDETLIRQVRGILASAEGFASVEVIRQEKNLGLAASIITGINMIFNTHDRVIVLEDDLVLAPGFLNYINRGLEAYKDVERVMHISGYMFPIEHPEKLPPSFFYRNTSCWGWGTWRRAWRHFNEDAATLLSDIEKQHRRKAFDINGQAGFFDMLNKQAKGEIDSWAIRWYASTFLRGGLCLHPARSLTQNIGHDSSGVHCQTSDRYHVALSDASDIAFPDAIVESEEALMQMARFYRSMRGSRHRRLINSVKKYLRP